MKKLLSVLLAAAAPHVLPRGKLSRAVFAAKTASLSVGIYIPSADLGIFLPSDRFSRTNFPKRAESYSVK